LKMNILKLLFKLRWLIIIFVVGVVIVYFTSYKGHAVSYDEVMNNISDAEQYFEKVVIYVEPTQYEVRIRALSIVNDAPDGIDVDSDAWKIWSINYWISSNIKYVQDPPGGYYTNAYEVLKNKSGDCDDFSILLASMYESVGLDAALVLLNTDSNPDIDHMACLVYWSGDANSFLDEEKVILKNMRITSPVFSLGISNIYTGKSHLMLDKYSSGVLLFSDVVMSKAGCLVGYVTHDPYEVAGIIDVGR
jgi:hypothetical protein